MRSNRNKYICITLIATGLFNITACSNKKENLQDINGIEKGLTNGKDKEELKKKEEIDSIKNPAWSFKTEGGIASSPVVKGNIIYFGSKDGNIYAVDIDTKSEVWRYSTKNPILSQVAIHENMLFFSSNNICYALDISTGKEIWKYKPNGKEETALRIDKWDYHDANPVIYKDVIYFGSGLGAVCGLDISTGDLVWEFTTDNKAQVRSTPLIHEDVMYFGDWSGKYYAVDIHSKEVKWVREYGAPFQSASTILNDTIFFAGRDTKIHAVNIINGEEKWSYKDPQDSWISGDPIIEEEIVYFPTSDSRKVYGMDVVNGNIKNTYRTFKNSFSKPVIHNNVLYVTTGDAYISPGNGKLEAFSLNEEGKKKWEVSVKTGGVFTSPIIHNDWIYYGSEDGSLYGIQLND